jgi:hypothetical protein
MKGNHAAKATRFWQVAVRYNKLANTKTLKTSTKRASARNQFATIKSSRGIDDQNSAVIRSHRAYHDHSRSLKIRNSTAAMQRHDSSAAAARPDVSRI